MLPILIAVVLASPVLALDLTITVSNNCDLNLSILSDDLYESGHSIPFLIQLNEVPKNFTISYWVEDANGRVVKKVSETRNQKKKSFTPSSDGEFYIFADLVGSSCNDVTTDNLVKKRVVAGESSPKSKKSVLFTSLIVIISLISVALIWRR